MIETKNKNLHALRELIKVLPFITKIIFQNSLYQEKDWVK